MNSHVFGRNRKISPMAAYREQFSATIIQELDKVQQHQEKELPNLIRDWSCNGPLLKRVERDTRLTKYEISIVQWETLTQLLVRYPEKLKAETLCNVFESAITLFESTVHVNASSEMLELYSKFWDATRRLIADVANYFASNSDSITHCTSDSHSMRNLLTIFSTVTGRSHFVRPIHDRIQASISEIITFEQKCLDKIIGKFRESAQAWIRAEMEAVSLRSGEDTIEFAIRLLSELNRVLKLCKPYLSTVLNSLKINLFHLVFAVWRNQIFSLLRRALKSVMPGVFNSSGWTPQEAAAVAEEDLFTLYQKLSHFLNLEDALDRFSVPLLQFFPLARIFLPCAIHWTQLIRAKNAYRIENACNLDNLTPIDTVSLASSSAVDVSEMLLKVNDFWTELAWPVPEESYCLLILVVHNVYRLAFQYVRALRFKLHDKIRPEIKTVEILNLECVVLNNIEQVIQHVGIVIERFQINKLMNEIAMQNGQPVQLCQYAVTLPNVVKTLDNKLKKLFTKVLRCVSFGQMTRCVLHEDNFDGKSFSFYLELLENVIVSLQLKLSPSLFPNVTDILWRNFLNTLGDLTSFKLESIEYYERLHILLLKMNELIQGYCNARQARAFPSSVRKKNSIQAAKLGRLLRLRGSTTRELQIEYLSIRFCEQSRVRPHSKISLGHVTIRIEYYRATETLKLEILNAVLNEDINHSYVKVQVLLREDVEESRYLYTQVRRTSYPQFETLLAIAIPYASWASGGIIRLWVKTRQNPVLQHRGRIIGEAFLPLETVLTTLAVVSRELTQPFIRLQLTKACSSLHCNVKSMILNVLGTRIRDKSAVTFVRRECREL